MNNYLYKREVDFESAYGARPGHRLLPSTRSVMGSTYAANTNLLWWIPPPNSRWQCLSAMPEQCPPHCQSNVLTHAEEKDP